MALQLNNYGLDEWPECSEENKPYYTVALEAFNDAIKTLESEEWLSKTAPWHKDGFCPKTGDICWKRPSDRIGLDMAVESVFDIDAESLFHEFQYEAEKSPEWNPGVAEFKVLEVVTPQSDIFHLTTTDYHHIISSRDMIVVRIWRKMSENCWMIASRSVEMDQHPPIKGKVRAIRHQGALKVWPHHEDPKKSCAITLINTDIKGMIPHFIVNHAAGRLALEGLGFVHARVKHLNSKIA